MSITNASGAELRPISRKELGMLVTMHRHALGWTQETLSEISGLNARTLQRVERGEASSADTRRALARAFRIEDIDAFNKPYAFKSSAEIKKEAEEFQRKHVTLTATTATSGMQLANLIEQAQMRCFQLPDGISPEVAETASKLFDYMAEYGEVKEMYSYSQKLEVHEELNAGITLLSSAGHSLCFALRKTTIVGRGWVNKTPMPVGIAYAFVVKRGDEPKLVVVPKALDLGF